MSSGMIEAGRGRAKILRRKYSNKISSSVGSNTKPGGSLLIDPMALIWFSFAMQTQTPPQDRGRTQRDACDEGC